jgi:hypothetical protein
MEWKSLSKDCTLAFNDLMFNSILLVRNSRVAESILPAAYIANSRRKMRKIRGSLSI